jgi:predicted nuclease of restriction endonuclease-like RecB superfamily
VLTADLVGARRRGSELRLPPTDDARRARIAALAAELTAVAREHRGEPREAVEAALSEAALAAETGAPGERRLFEAVCKLVCDGLRFEEPAREEAVACRREIFRRAAATRRAAPAAGFDRAAILEALAAERATTAAALDAGLFADRPGAQRLLSVEVTAPRLLAAGFEISEAQAVLLRATKLEAVVRAADAALYRRLFGRLKFLRLLPAIARVPNGYRIEIDGPLSLFQGGGRYGLQLALALPAIADCDVWSIEADVRWGAERRDLRFRLSGTATGDDGRVSGGSKGPSQGPFLSDELSAFIAAFERLDSGWRIDREPAVLDLPGAGLCVPDLAFVRARDGACVYFELLGFWSREAVFRRIDLVRAGLPQRILFAVSKGLRVGEALLDDAPTAALYVFGRVIAAKEILSRLESLAG